MNGKELRSLREDLGLSREAFAKRSGISAHTITYWENENAPIKPKYEPSIAKVVGSAVKNTPVTDVTLPQAFSPMSFMLLTQAIEAADKMGINEKQYLVLRLVDQIRSVDSESTII